MSMVRFNPDDHSYWIGKRKLDSVSSLVKSLTPPFDRDRISKQVAFKKGISVEEVLKEWDTKSEVGRDRGTLVHSYVDDVLLERSDPVLSVMNEKIPEMEAFDKAWDAFKGRMKARVAAREFQVYSKRLRVAGRVDILLSVRSDGKRKKCVFDWKTGKFNRYSQFGRMLPPFDDLTDCELSRYSLQLAMYRVLMERMHLEEECDDGYLVHLKPSGDYFIHRALDLKDRVEEWLEERVTE